MPRKIPKIFIQVFICEKLGYLTSARELRIKPLTRRKDMVLHKTALMELLYDPSTDILRVIWPDLESATTTDIDQNLIFIKDAVSSYFISRFLLDARQTTNLPEIKLFHKVLVQFFQCLAGTNMHKVARLQSKSLRREVRAEIVAGILKPEEHPHIEYKNFTKEEEAVKWLLTE